MVLVHTLAPPQYSASSSITLALMPNRREVWFATAGAQEATKPGSSKGTARSPQWQHMSQVACRPRRRGSDFVVTLEAWWRILNQCQNSKSGCVSVAYCGGMGGLFVQQQN